jgi:methylated-DNA-protein-cysteine methyltransferase-like protein
MNPAAARRAVNPPASKPALPETAMAVLDVVDTIPPGRVMSYGAIARHLGTGSARQVGQVLARHGHEVAWHRVVMADGSPAPHHGTEQLGRLRSEGVALRAGRVVMGEARWDPGAELQL